mmetsp:Transcript_17530/g.54757  ORF Transcript_17530/g.54757 Transcript_17530/m.54757 type:complete len:265 (-) Transcript_17530:217-1011(-)
MVPPSSRGLFREFRRPLRGARRPRRSPLGIRARGIFLSRRRIFLLERGAPRRLLLGLLLLLGVRRRLLRDGLVLSRGGDEGLLLPRLGPSSRLLRDARRRDAGARRQSVKVSQHRRQAAGDAKDAHEKGDVYPQLDVLLERVVVLVQQRVPQRAQLQRGGIVKIAEIVLQGRDQRVPRRPVQAPTQRDHLGIVERRRAVLYHQQDDRQRRRLLDARRRRRRRAERPVRVRLLQQLVTRRARLVRHELTRHRQRRLVQALAREQH